MTTATITPIPDRYLDRIEDAHYANPCAVYKVPPSELPQFIPPQQPHPAGFPRSRELLDSIDYVPRKQSKPIELSSKPKTPKTPKQKPDRPSGAAHTAPRERQRRAIPASCLENHDRLRQLARQSVSKGEMTSIYRLCLQAGLNGCYCSTYPELSRELQEILGDRLNPRGAKAIQAQAEANARKVLEKAQEWASAGRTGSARELCLESGVNEHYLAKRKKIRLQVENVLSLRKSTPQEGHDRACAQRRATVLMQVHQWVAVGRRKSIEALCSESGLSHKWFWEQTKEFQFQVKSMLACLPFEKEQD